eukprot:3688706-Prymnesium_polylepis.1
MRHAPCAMRGPARLDGSIHMDSDGRSEARIGDRYAAFPPSVGTRQELAVLSFGCPAVSTHTCDVPCAMRHAPCVMRHVP